MALKATTRFIDANGVEYKIGEPIIEKDLDKDYLKALEKAGMVSGTGAKPHVEPKAPEAPKVASKVAGDDQVKSSQPEEINTVSGILPDPVADRATGEGTGEYHVPVGSVSGGEPASVEPESSVVGTVSAGATPEVAEKPVSKFAPKNKKAPATKAE